MRVLNGKEEVFLSKMKELRYKSITEGRDRFKNIADFQNAFTSDDVIVETLLLLHDKGSLFSYKMNVADHRSMEAIFSKCGYSTDGKTPLAVIEARKKTEAERLAKLEAERKAQVELQKKRKELLTELEKL